MAKDEPTKAEASAKAKDDDLPEGAVRLDPVEADDKRGIREQGGVVRSDEPRSLAATPMSNEKYEVKPGQEVRFKDADMSKIKEAVVALAMEDPGAARLALFGEASAPTYGRLPGDPANVVPDPAKVKDMADGELEKRDKAEEAREEAAKESSGQPESVSVS